MPSGLAKASEMSRFRRCLGEGDDGKPGENRVFHPFLGVGICALAMSKRRSLEFGSFGAVKEFCVLGGGGGE